MPSSMVLPSSLLLLYALCFLTFVFMLKRETSAEMFEAVMQRVIDTPFRQDPFATLHDVRGGNEVYEWISKVFLPQVYIDQPSPLERGAYCTDNSKCLLNEGDVQSNAQCAGSLQAGLNNCPSYMGSETDCCEQCVGPDCQNFAIATRIGDIGNSTSVEDVSANCAVQMQGWLQDLHGWNGPVQGQSRRLQAPPPGVKEFLYCPEWLSKVQSDAETRTVDTGEPIMVAGFNRLIMGRMSLKRVAFTQSTSKSFVNAYPTMLSTTRTDPYSFWKSYENTQSFGPDGRALYVYKAGEGFMDAGGFIQHLDFERSRDEIFDSLATLKRHHWFDLNQGSFVFELLMYNGNVNNFLYVAFIFQHDFTGSTRVTVEACPLDLSLHDTSITETYVRFAIYLIIVLLWCYFTKGEFEDLIGSPIEYFSDPVSVLQLASLALTLVCIVLYLMVTLSYTYINFKFPLALPQKERFQEFQDLANLAFGMERFSGVVAANTFLVCIRAVVAACVLMPQLGLVVDSVRHVKHTMTAWFAMYAAMLAGFSMAGFFIFGHIAADFRSWPASFITAVKVSMGGRVYPSLTSGDADVSFMCFVAFTIPFLLFHEVFYSILLSGYLKNREHMRKNFDSTNYPLLRLAVITKTWVKEYSQYFNVCLAPFLRVCFGRTGGVNRVNKELVNLLKDRRPTKLKMREVTYEKKTTGGRDITLDEDVQITVEKPTYPGGLTQWFVNATKNAGPASEAKVEKGFRLIEIRTHGQRDRESFRTLDVLGNPQDPKKFLSEKADKLPVTLVFEGPAKPPIWEPLGYMVFLVLIVQFFIAVTRIRDSYSLVAVFEDSLLAAEWTTYNPQQDVSYSGMDRMGHVPDFLGAAIVEGGYSCISGVDVGADVTCSAEANMAPRDGWFLFKGDEVQGEATSSEGGVQLIAPLPERPEAAAGLSLGYVPLTPPASFAGEEYICATENARQERNCPECVMGPTCSCNGAVKFGYGSGSDWTPWFSVMGEIQCTPSAFEIEAQDENTTQGHVCVCRVEYRKLDDAVRMQDYNVGVMPNNHVRMTVQVPCFKDNLEERYRLTYKYIWDPKQASWDGCANRDCMQAAKERRDSCKNADGDVQDLDMLKGSRSGVTYEFSRTGTYRDLGGFAIGFGRTEEEAEMVAEILRQDGLLTRRAVSTVFEMVTYNAIYDLFMYSTVQFGLGPTGKLKKDVTNSAFPLAIFSSGAMPGEDSVRVWVWFSFFFYIIAALVMLALLLRALWVQYKITKASELAGGPAAFPLTVVYYLMDDWWNILETAMVALDFSVIIQLCRLMLMEQTFHVESGTKSWTTEYAFVRMVNMTAEDQVGHFQRAADLFSDFAGFAAIRGFLLWLRILRYYKSSNNLRAVVSTVSFAKADLLLTFAVNALMLVAFVVLIGYRFGVVATAFGSMTGCFVNLFLFLVGRFDFDVQASNGPLFWFCIFPTFQAFYLLFVGIVLATLVSRWMDSRRDAQDGSAKGNADAFKEWVKKRFRGGKDDGSEESKTMVEAKFWRDQSILQYLHTLDENGKVRVDTTEDTDDRKKKSKKGEDKHHSRHENSHAQQANQDDEEEGHVDFNFAEGSNEDKRKFWRCFEKAHMEIASKRCKQVSADSRKDRDSDTGAGVGAVDGRESHRTSGRESGQEKQKRGRQKQKGEEKPVEYSPYIGLYILDEAVEPSTLENARRTLAKILSEDEEPLNEVWLDALVTVLEECGIVGELQKLFMPAPIERPRKLTDWKAFSDRKEKLEERIRAFVDLLREEARLKRADYLCAKAQEKERVLKRQSLVLTDYLDTLEKQIEKLNTELREQGPQ